MFPRRESDLGMEDMLSGCWETGVEKGLPLRLTAAGGNEVDCEMVWEESVDDQERGPTPEQLALWRRSVVTTDRSPVSKDHVEGRFQYRCFSVEWRSSTLLDREQFIDQLFGVIGGETPFVMGVTARPSRADYFLLVRSKSLLRWRDWRKTLMFGHGGEAECEALFMRLQVPCRQSEEGTTAFVQEMTSMCEMYAHTYRYRELEMVREHEKSHARSGRKRKVTEIDEQEEI
jgi:hypothetical protein